MGSKRVESVSTNNLRVGSSPALGNYLRDNGTGLFLPTSLNNLRNDLGVGRTQTQVFYGTNVLQNLTFTIPDWAREFEYDIVAVGGAAGSGATCSTITTAISGGCGGASAGRSRDRLIVSELLALNGGSRILSFNLPPISIGGAGITTTLTTVTPGNPGQAGGDVTLSSNGYTIAVVGGGLGGAAGSGVATTAAANYTGSGGTWLNAGGVNSITVTANNGSFSSAVETPAGGSAGGGISTGNVSLGRGGSSRGGIGRRPISETLPGLGVNATEILFNGLPTYGNSGGSSTSALSGASLPGGNGINGSGGAGSGASRGTSGKGGDGGRCFIILKFFGSDISVGRQGFTTDYQESALRPSTRGDGTSALQIGDRWYDLTTRTTWFWDIKPNAIGGNFSGWFEECEPRIAAFSQTGATAGYFSPIAIPAPNANKSIYIADFGYAMARFSPQDGTNYWSILAERVTASDVRTTFQNINVNVPTLPTGLDQITDTISINQVLTTASGAAKVRFFVNRNGNPGQLSEPSVWYSWKYCR